jgi:large subunit ribosomal protein L9
MEIILKEDIIGLGYKNDIVNVKSGYGRNYLIPQGKGVIASPMAKKILAENLKQQAHKLAAIKADAEKKAETLAGVALEIAAKVSTTGQLYGSVGANQVAEELKKLGKEVDRKIITMKEAKTIGDFVALVHFHKEVTVEVPVKVVAENAAELKAAAEEEAAIRAAAEAKAAAAAAAEAAEEAAEEETPAEAPAEEEASATEE